MIVTVKQPHQGDREGAPWQSTVCVCVTWRIIPPLPINALPPLAGEPRRDSVHAQEERQLAAVEQVVLHDMPDDPSARQVNALAVPVVGEGLSHLVGTPA